MPLDPVIVVSGFPRTGTSTMMRMLYFGGVDVISVEEKMVANHEFDPYGNFELPDNELKKMRTEWTPEYTAGKAVKIVSPYIYHACPYDRPAQVIFMIRDPNEIVASLLALGTVWEWDPIESVKASHDFFEFHSIPVKDVKYKDMLKYPRSTAMEVAEWLNLDTSGQNIVKMASAVDPKPREAFEGKGNQKRLVTYQFDWMTVDNKYGIELDKGGRE